MTIMKLTPVKYEWGSQWGVFNGKVSAQKVGEALEELRRKKGDDAITAGEVVEAARPRRSKMHDAFEWDDGIAADNWRVHQARHVLRTIRITVEEAEPRFANVHVRTDDGRNAYVPVSVMARRPDYQQQVRHEAARYLAGIHVRLVALGLEVEELQPVIAVVERAREQLQADEEAAD